MTNREKVIYSIERCICHVPDACRDCGYDNHEYNECVEKLLRDALELLREQEPVEPKWASGIKGGADALCGSCSAWLSDHSWAYCPRCGKSVKWE